MKLLALVALLSVIAASAVPVPPPAAGGAAPPTAPLAAPPANPAAPPAPKPAAPEAAALTALSNNLAGAINCAAANASPKPVAPVPAAAPAPAAPVLAAKPKGVVPPNAAGANTASFLEQDPNAAPAAPAAAPAPEANAAGLDAGNGNAVAAPPTTNQLIKYLTGLNGGNPVTADSITALCSAGGAGAQKQKQKQKQKQVQKANQVQKSKLLLAGSAPKVPIAGGNGLVANPTSLVQVFSRLLNKPTAVVPKAGGYAPAPPSATPAPNGAAAPAAAPEAAPQAPQAAAPAAADPALIQLHKAFCLVLPKLGAGILNTCPTAANDNADLDLSPLLAVLAAPSDAFPPAQKPKIPIAPVPAGAPAPATAVAF